MVFVAWLSLTCSAKGSAFGASRFPVAWGFAITNFVWWIGIGHAGTLISAILLLLNQSWRNSINRFAEAMTLFAVACAGMFPLLHLGRPWLFYWLFPYPEHHDGSAAVPQPAGVGRVRGFHICHGVATVLVSRHDSRPRHRSAIKRRAGSRYAFYGVLAFGWRGASRHWKYHETASLLLAGLATPLVLSVHTVVSFDFTIAILPGWHSTIFPPYFVSGAIYSGFAMVLLLCIPLRDCLRTAEPDHRAAPEQLRQADARNGLGSGLHVCHRAVHSLVQRQ